MGITDIIGMTIIGLAAVYFLYRSITKKSSHCTGCSCSSSSASSSMCDQKQHTEADYRE